MIGFKKTVTIALSTALFGGCSIYQAVHAPTPVEYKQVKVGSTRTETISRLGYPKMTDQKNNLKDTPPPLAAGFIRTNKPPPSLINCSDSVALKCKKDSGFIILIGIIRLLKHPLVFLTRGSSIKYQGVTLQSMG